MTDVATMTCPRCGNLMAVDKGFVVWCEKCDWNVDAGSSPELSQREQKKEARARLRGKRLFEELSGSPLSRPGFSGERLVSFVLAATIHMTTLVVLGLGLYIFVTNFGTFYGIGVGLALILAAILLRPRLGSLKSGTVILPRESAPALYGVVDRIGGQLGARPVDVIALDASFNAAHGQVGLRRRRILWIGLSLWNVLDDRQRLALLGHELGHQVNGDLTHGVVVGSALRTLGEWHAILQAPVYRQGTGSVFEALEALGQVIARFAMWLLRGAVNVLYEFELSLVFRSQQRAEYLADAIAARVGSTDAMQGCLDLLHLSRPCWMAVRFAAQRDEPDIWEPERKFLAELPAKEWERFRRLAARDGTSIDSTHPPTNLRIEMLSRQPAQAVQIELSASESAAVAAEVASGVKLVAAQLKMRLAR